MKTNDLIKAMKDIVSLYEDSCENESLLRKEVSMWRHYFLKKECKPFSESRKYFIEKEFLLTSSEKMITENPKNILKELEKSSEGK